MTAFEFFRSTDSSAAVRQERILTERRQAFLDSLALRANVLPIGPRIGAPIEPYRQTYANSCFVAGLLACTPNPTEDKERSITSRLQHVGLMDASGVAALDPPAVNYVLAEDGVRIVPLGDGSTPGADRGVAEELLDTLQESTAVMVNTRSSAFEPGHWMVLAGIKRITGSREQFDWMNPASGVEISDSTVVAERFVPNPGVGLQAFAVETSPGFEVIAHVTGYRS